MIIILGIIIFLIILGIIVIVHEFGHLIIAKRNGVYCHEFSIGLGPKIYTFYKDASGTVYNLRAIPIGGYVQLSGEHSGFEKDEEIPADQKLDNKKKWPKFKILVAGSFMNFILAFLIFLIYSFFGGVPSENIVQVDGTSLAAKSGIETGDTILKINGNKINSFTDIQNDFEKDNTNYQIVYKDASESNEIENTTIHKYKGEVGFSPYKNKYELFDSIEYTFQIMIKTIQSIFIGLGLIISGQYGIKDLTGPIGIAAVTTQVAKLGFLQVLFWTAFLSLNIGFMNLLPIPALDGGRIFFILIEAISGKKISNSMEEKINTGVFVALLLLIVYVSFWDIFRIITLN